MTWRAEDPQGFESDKIAALAVPYLQGRALDVGCGIRKVWPSVIGVDDGSAFGAATGADFKSAADDLSMFVSGTFDAVFSSHVLEDFPRDRVPTVIAEWSRLLKIGGHLVLYLPSANLYPLVGAVHANPNHRWNIYPGDIENILREMVGQEFGWELLESEERGSTNEYSLFIVARKTAGGWRENVWQRNPGGKRRCLVIRYGAIGDAIIASSVFPGLQEQGYHVTVNCKPATYEVLRHDPHVDEWMIQDTDFVPNSDLGLYWERIKGRYDRVVNLCESIERSVLMDTSRLQHDYPPSVRRALFGSINYLERTHVIAGVPFARKQRFHASHAELQCAHRERGERRPAILWSVNGSAPHKVYPHIPVVLAWLLERTPCHIWLTGDAGIGKALQDALIEAIRKSGRTDFSRIHCMAGIWSVREALTFGQVADCVVGPETGVLNAVAFEPVAKVIYLSHSSHTNLTRDWRNATVLQPASDKAPCFPCHLLHVGWEHCHQDSETRAALCAAHVAPEAVFEGIVRAVLVEKAA